jgi:hypothetical protein
MLNSADVNRSIYLIRIKEKIPPPMFVWFEEAKTITTDQGETLITCSIIDQAALHGLLSKIRDLNLTLISIVRDDPSKNLIDSSE